MEEDTDMEAMQQELREAFRLYDREGNGYITTDVFRDILHELDDALSPEELDMIIDEVDADGSGTVDFEGTCNVLEIRLFKLLSENLYELNEFNEFKTNRASKIYTTLNQTNLRCKTILEIQ